MPEAGLTHLDDRGAARMVDVGAKPSTARRAVATGRLRCSADTLARVLDGDVPKGDVAAVARIAGILAAKRTGELIPLCHPLALDAVSVDIAVEPDGPALRATATASATGPTGVEMEALTAVGVALLALYDMLKGLERGLWIERVELVEKRGGTRGDWTLAGGAAP